MVDIKQPITTTRLGRRRFKQQLRILICLVQRELREAYLGLTNWDLSTNSTWHKHDEVSPTRRQSEELYRTCKPVQGRVQQLTESPRGTEQLGVVGWRRERYRGKKQKEYSSVKWKQPPVYDADVQAGAKNKREQRARNDISADNNKPDGQFVDSPKLYKEQHSKPNQASVIACSITIPYKSTMNSISSHATWCTVSRKM